jgi:tRNA (cmo5U34)-methyltransferase
MDPDSTAPGWTAQSSQFFLDYGRYFVPDRETQIATICALIPPPAGPCEVLELSCGEGLLAEAILARFPACTVVGLDGAPEMLDRARERLAPFGSRFVAQLFDLAATDWRTWPRPVHAVVTSLTVHHLDGPGKQALFRDIYAMLAPGGAFVIADVVQPEGELGRQVAAAAWDAAVRERALALDGNEAAFARFEELQWNMYAYPEDEAESIDHPSPLPGQLTWLAAAGFAEVDVYWMRAGHAIFGGRKL